MRLQSDVNNPEKWSTKWLLQFNGNPNPEKCNVVQQKGYKVGPRVTETKVRGDEQTQCTGVVVAGEKASKRRHHRSLKNQNVPSQTFFQFAFSCSDDRLLRGHRFKLFKNTCRLRRDLTFSARELLMCGISSQMRLSTV